MVNYLVRTLTCQHQTTTVMHTLQVIKDHAALIIANGGPKNRNEQEVMTIFNRLTGKGAANAGKRTKKNHNNNW